MGATTGALSFLLIFSVSAGCAYVPTTSLRYEPVATTYDARRTHSVAVLPLEEARGPKRHPSLQGRAFMTYIPLLPYVKGSLPLGDPRLLQKADLPVGREGLPRAAEARVR